MHRPSSGSSESQTDWRARPCRVSVVPEGREAARAAVLNEPGHLDLETLWVDRPGAREVRLRPVSVGLCHSDLHYIDGTHTTELPEVLGHEAAGVVESIGELVTSVDVGDHVVTSLTMFCGRCRYCTSGRMSLCSERASLRRRPRPALVDRDGTPVGVMGGIGAFAELVVVHENAVTRIPRDLDMRIGSLFGCAVLTGVGAVTRSARVPVGATVAVVGCGGIGLAVVQGALVAGASRIVRDRPLPCQARGRTCLRRHGCPHVRRADCRRAHGARARRRRLLVRGRGPGRDSRARVRCAGAGWHLHGPGHGAGRDPDPR